MVSVGIHTVALAWDYLQYQAYGMVILIYEKWKKGLQGYVAPDREGAQIGRHGIILVS